jgi:hypothetical protein
MTSGKIPLVLLVVICIGVLVEFGALYQLQITSPAQDDDFPEAINTSIRRWSCKNQIVTELVAGGLTLEESVALFQALDQADPPIQSHFDKETQKVMLHPVAPIVSEERSRREVIEYLNVLLTVR